MSDRPAQIWILGLLVGLLVPPAFSAECRPGAITGEVTHVRDGDTIEVAGLPIRLQGLAAPELHEPGGYPAGFAMRELAFERPATCLLTGERNHDRCVGTCSVDGLDLGLAMVRTGYARDCRRYSRGRYAAAEAAAAREGATIRSTYQLPGYCR